MRITFPIESKTYTEYCIYCHSPDTLRAVRGKDGLQYECSKCNKTASRAIIMDPDLKWSIDSDKEYVHESVGIFIFNDQKEFLMFKLNKYPFGATIPAGHVDIDEDPEKEAEGKMKKSAKEGKKKSDKAKQDRNGEKEKVKPNEQKDANDPTPTEEQEKKLNESNEKSSKKRQQNNEDKSYNDRKYDAKNW